MKSRIAVSVLSLLTAILSLSVGGCAGKNTVSEGGSMSNADGVSSSSVDSGSSAYENVSDTSEDSGNSDISNSAQPEKLGVYGITEIPDIPCGDRSREGKADLYEYAEALEGALDKMVFETHTAGEYKLSLVGADVRTDTANYPGSVYAQMLWVEVEKNGVLLHTNRFDRTESYYGNEVLYQVEYASEYRLLADKIGSYIDLYELKYPVIARRYFFDELSPTATEGIVEFLPIKDDVIIANTAIGKCEKGTGVTLNIASRTKLNLNKSFSMCYLSPCSGDDLTAVDGNTLVDETTGIRFVFDFSKLPKITEYRAEIIG